MHASQAMESVYKQLVHPDDDLILLFTPPFDRTARDPGYIKGYPPGIRENGGQYTHAAAWCVIALAQSGDGDGAGELLSLINPINLSATRSGSRRYRVEPYVIAADVYSTGANSGRGGWSWYTGAAGWIYRATLEYVLGVRKEGDTLVIAPSIPSHWPQFEVSYTHNGTIYRIVVSNPSRVSRGIRAATLNGTSLQTTDTGTLRVPLNGSGKVQQINIIMGISGSAVAAA